MMDKTLFCHVFRHEDSWYFYDAITNDLFECDEAVAAVVKVWDHLADPETRLALDEQWTSARVEAALAEVYELQQTVGALVPQALTVLENCPTCHNPDAYKDQISHLQLNVSEQCNLRCEYCPYTKGRQGTRLHNDQFMSLDTAIAAADFFLARCEKVEDPAFSFYGGEPLLGFDMIKDIVKHVRSRPGGKKIRFIIDTNGVLIDEEVAAFVNEEGIHIQISLDGPQHIHDRYRRTRNGKDSFDLVMAGAKQLLRNDPQSHKRIRFNAVLAPPSDIEAVVDFFTDFPLYKEFNIEAQPSVGIDFADLTGIDFHPCEISTSSEADPDQAYERLQSRYIEACSCGRHEDLSPVMHAIFDKEIINFHHRSRAPMAQSVFPTGSCQPGQRKLFVKVDGSLMPCERGGDNMIIGHINTGIDLAAIDDFFRKLIGAVGHRCQSCWAIRRCTLCFIHMSDPLAQGKAEVPEQLCRGVRRTNEITFQNYLSLKNSGPEAIEWLKHSVIV